MAKAITDVTIHVAELPEIKELVETLRGRIADDTWRVSSSDFAQGQDWCCGYEFTVADGLKAGFYLHLEIDGKALRGHAARRDFSRSWRAHRVVGYEGLADD